jgi:GT2 family glycosyltransferase
MWHLLHEREAAREASSNAPEIQRVFESDTNDTSPQRILLLSRYISCSHGQKAPVMKSVTVVLPVYNGLRFVRPCLNALADHTDPAIFRLFLMDDCSDNHTAEFLRKEIKRFDDAILLRNEENLGFLQTCNRAWAECDSPFVLLLNSDVLVTPDWLPRLLRCAEQDSRIASVNPLTNHASNIELPIPPGCNHLGLDRRLAHRPSRCHDVVTGVGFCMLLRRDAVGETLFDEIYGKGYCEESDLCMRLTTSGWRTVSAENVYVHHRGHASFSDRDERYLANRQVFDSRWGQEYQRQYQEFLRRDPLKEVRTELRHPLRMRPVRHARYVLNDVAERLRNGQRRTPLRKLIRPFLRPASTRYIQYSDRLLRSDRPTVTYIVAKLSVSGGVLSVIQLVNELILQGFDARIATLDIDPEVLNWTWLLTEPMLFLTLRDLIKDLPATDIAVGTLWNTAPWVHALTALGKARTTAYFLQDYEPWFIPEWETDTRQRIIADYDLIPNRIVKSDWLAGKLAEHGYETTKISLGMDLDMFYPRDRTPGPPTVLTMARPSTPWRGFSTAVQALSEVKRQIPETRIVLFGTDDLDSAEIPFDFESAGRIVNQNRIAQLYSDADVFLDASTFQGFGRCALEAMACGTSVVLTNVGGVMEYATPEENCLAVPPSAPAETASALLRLLRNEGLRQHVVRTGLTTAHRFCHRREALETAVYFHRLLEND